MCYSKEKKVRTNFNLRFRQIVQTFIYYYQTCPHHRLIQIEHSFRWISFTNTSFVDKELVLYLVIRSWTSSYVEKKENENLILCPRVCEWERKKTSIELLAT